jgi:hypothetical protein
VGQSSVNSDLLEHIDFEYLRNTAHLIFNLTNRSTCHAEAAKLILKKLTMLI